jgi:hypothetical protein
MLQHDVEESQAEMKQQHNNRPAKIPDSQMSSKKGIKTRQATEYILPPQYRG